MTTQTLQTALGQRLIRGIPVIVADSFGRAPLRGKQMIVASKSTVKCNGKGRCAGTWCVGLAVFITNPTTSNEDKEMGWRGGTTKICLTHLKDSDNDLLLPAPALRAQCVTSLNESSSLTEGVVTWEALACASADQDLILMTSLARRLKSENEKLKCKVIEVQSQLIKGLTTG